MAHDFDLITLGAGSGGVAASRRAALHGAKVAIVEGALASGGPGGPGEIKKPNLIIAGIDPVAVDSYGVSLVPWYGQNFKGRQVEHLLIAHQRGLGKIDIDQLKIFKEKA